MNFKFNKTKGNSTCPTLTTQFPASINVANLNGVNGFAITGFSANSEGGGSVSGAGDLNKDGIVDLVIGAPITRGPLVVQYLVISNLKKS